MNKGRYEFPDKEEQNAWETIVGWVIERMLPESYPEEWDATPLDLNPILLGACVEAHGWDWEYDSLERGDAWSYYTHSDYPNKRMCIYANNNVFKLTMVIYDKEEE
jgi:hypothetical protein